MKKYEIIKNWLQNNISTGILVPNDKLPSESELMNQFGVSRNAVRQAINELIKDQLVESRHGIGTFVVKRRNDGTSNIGLICYRTSSYIFPKIIHGVNKIIQKSGYNLLLSESWYDLNIEKALILGLRQKNLGGLIITPVQDEGVRNNAKLLRELEQKGVPVVLLDNDFPEYNFTSVVLADKNVGIEAARYVWDAGHRDIGIIYSRNYRPKILRKEGSLFFLSNQGSPLSNDRIFGIEGQSSGRKVYREIRTIVDTVAKLPTVFICSSDDEALILMYILRKKGVKVPDDVSIISYDNSQSSQFSYPGLTTINHPSEYMGELVASMLLNKINNPGIRINSRTTIDSYVVKRDSVKVI